MTSIGALQVPPTAAVYGAIQYSGGVIFAGLRQGSQA